MTSEPASRGNARGDQLFCPKCRRLCAETGLWNCASQPSPGNPFGWWACCEVCHTVLEQEEGWSEHAKKFAGLRLVCKSCFKTALRGHRRLSLAV